MSEKRERALSPEERSSGSVSSKAGSLRNVSAKSSGGERKKRLIVGITGATGSIYGLRILEALRASSGWESHLIVSDAGMLNAWQEYKLARKDIQKLADVVHNVRDIGASVASGSFLTEGMVIAPCSMKSLSGVAHAFSDNLITRAADVILKERRRLVLVTRESPLNLAHLRNMTAVTEMGGIIFPPVPAFYSGAKTIDDLVNHTVGRVLDLFGVEHDSIKRWQGIKNDVLER
jgi:polyprenyl P-hydroxybenzoate/phenylacrylic acid decarboxylase-like protein